MSETLCIEKTLMDSAFIIKLEGRIVEKYIHEIKDLLQVTWKECPNNKDIDEKDAYSIIIDMSEVTYLDSSMLGAIIDALYKHEECGKGLYIGGVNDEVRMALELLQLHKIVMIFPDQETALAHVEGKIS